MAPLSWAWDLDGIQKDGLRVQSRKNGKEMR